VERVHGVVDRAACSGPRWTAGGADRRRGGASPVSGASGAVGPRSSPTAAGDEEDDTAEPVRGSP
jgi:hypothetical protein